MLGNIHVDRYPAGAGSSCCIRSICGVHPAVTAAAYSSFDLTAVRIGVKISGNARISASDPGPLCEISECLIKYLSFLPDLICFYTFSSRFRPVHLLAIQAARTVSTIPNR